MFSKEFRILSLAMTLVLFSLFTYGSTSVFAGCSWFHRGNSNPLARTDWMSQLDDTLRISHLSIPGTHDAMSRCGGPGVICQGMRLNTQLEAGIRAVDIRCRRYHNHFDITHGCFMQGDDCGALADHYEFDDALCICVEFLQEHPDETILMRVHKEGCEFSPFSSFEEIYRNYTENRGCTSGPTGEWVQFSDYIWSDSLWSYNDSLPRLGDVRGKILILQDFPAAGSYGPAWTSFDIQDHYKVYYTCHGDNMDRKWSRIKTQVNDARAGSPDKLFFNFTSGSGGINPVDVARGLTVFWCFAYEDGMNKRTYQYLKQFFNSNNPGRVGVVMMDFPGAGLIDMIIAQNGLPAYCLNNPPVADANGPYEAMEGSEITFDASGSYDPDGDSLQYLWHLWDVVVSADSVILDTIPIWDQDGWSDSPIAHYTIYDEDTCYALVEVREVPPAQVVMDMAGVMVTNAAPIVYIDSLTSPVEGCILPGQDVYFYGSFTDPGVYDTHTAWWDFDDGTSLPDTVTEEHEIPDASGTVSHAHVYGGAGTYNVVLTITDEDGGIGDDSLEVWIRTASEAVDFLDSLIQDLPPSCFRGQAAQRKQTFSNKCQAVKNALGAGGNLQGVINRLMNDIRTKADGSVDGSSHNDWITCQEAQEEICLIVDELVRYLESLQEPVPIGIIAQLPPHVGQEGDLKALRKELIPTEFCLSQCYPNPFNPETRFKYQIPIAGYVTIKIFNVTGQEMITLVDENLTAGCYTTTWNGRDAHCQEVSSGIYFCTMQAGKFTQTKKMVLLK
jgi:1-phosphatidylinositol phosphodiesterase